MHLDLAPKDPCSGGSVYLITKTLRSSRSNLVRTFGSFFFLFSLHPTHSQSPRWKRNRCHLRKKMWDQISKNLTSFPTISKSNQVGKTEKRYWKATQSRPVQPLSITTSTREDGVYLLTWWVRTTRERRVLSLSSQIWKWWAKNRMRAHATAFSTPSTLLL